MEKKIEEKLQNEMYSAAFFYIKIVCYSARKAAIVI